MVHFEGVRPPARERLPRKVMVMELRFCVCEMLLLLFAGAGEPSSCCQEPGSFRIDPKSWNIQDGRRDYTHVDAVEILKLVITDWLTNPKVKEQPYHYLIDPDDDTGNGPTPKLERLLIDERYVPKDFDVKISGMKVELVDRSKRDLKKAEMCIRIDRFEPNQDGSIDIEFLHSGFGIIGGAWTTYHAKKVNGKWAVEFAGLFDP